MSNTLLRPAILILLAEEESHGYALMGRLAEIGVDVPPTTGGLYRTLRSMADEELIWPSWDVPDRGPAKRVYAITELGKKILDEEYMPSLTAHMRTTRDLLNRRRKQSPRPELWRLGDRSTK